MKQLSALFVGDESLTLACIQQWLDAGHLVSGLATDNPDLITWALAEGLRVDAPGPSLADGVRDMTFDWVMSVANLRLLPEALLAQAKQGAVNFHDALLPRYAGLNAPVWARINGETQHGITWHLITMEIDKGDVIAQRSFEITDTDTALSLNTKCYSAAIESFGDVIAAVENGVPAPVVQDMSQRSYVGRFDRPDGGGILQLDGPRMSALCMVLGLDHESYTNPLALAKLWTGTELIAVKTAKLSDADLGSGDWRRLAQDRILLGFADGALELGGLTPLSAAPLALDEDGRLPILTSQEAAACRQDAERLAKGEPKWCRRLLAMHSAVWPKMAAPGDVSQITLALPNLGAQAMADLALHFARVSCGQDDADIALAHPTATPIGAGWVPYNGGREIADLSADPGFAADTLARFPELTGRSCPDIGHNMDEEALFGCAVTLTPRALHYDTARVAPEMAELLADRVTAMARAAAKGKDMPSMSEIERALVLDAWNDTSVEIDQSATMASAFAKQVAAQPEAPALIFGQTTLSYAQLDARANAAARVLEQMGAQRGDLIGLATSRSASLVVAALAIHKIGAAYVPMDPSYPADRLALFAEDSDAQIIVTESAVQAVLPKGAALLVLDTDPRLASAETAPFESRAEPDDLAYVIFTSGSTGRPKGVMVEHRNVINFYAGMDERAPAKPQDCWLALTSLSFDISVLEIFYTMARGARVVLVREEDRLETTSSVVSEGDMDFSLFYWGNDDGVGRDKYALLLEGAKFADANGFRAIWTPERHFHAFGGPYPNPSVTGAAVAAVTQNIDVRAGSCVAPLHHTARIAEEWAVIDNLTGGRAGLAIASGWQPDDFVLRPENTPPENKPAMLRQIDELRALWRGEAVAFPRQDGQMHDVVTQPRPVSKDLPIWVTTAGNPATWEEAGKIGANVLTHLLGQSVDDVAEKIKLYHKALRAAGHDPADFKVTLMLHTYLDETREQARDIARGPMKAYLQSAAALIKQYAWAFPAFKRPEGAKNAFDLSLDGLSEGEMDAILDFAFERYFEESGLFGTIEDALARVEDVKAIGVTEVACLIDYGISREQVLAGLRPLAEVVAKANEAAVDDPTDLSIGAQIKRHGVTHMQCTPSMARLLLSDTQTRKALRGLEQILLGGEALPAALVAEMNDATDAPVENMYGPTETTIWSTTAAASAEHAIAPVGSPIANTQVYVLDDDMRPMPVGVEGELFIGGLGVTRGYWKRDDLTEERFVPNPFGHGRLYRTGDLVRWQSDGQLAFVGRADGQIKLRGHRIELGEIEAALVAQEGVLEAVCVVRGETQLVAYMRGDGQPAEVRRLMAEALPSYMVPSQIVPLDSFPLTPNKKVDRNALPDPAKRAPAAPSKPASATPTRAAHARQTAPAANQAASTEVAAKVAMIWADVLGVQSIQNKDNFFDLGGHSLLAVQAHRAIRTQLGAPALSIADVFGYPTLNGLVDRIVQLHPELAGAIHETTAPAHSQTLRSATGEHAEGKRRDAIARRKEMRARRMR